MVGRFHSILAARRARYLAGAPIFATALLAMTAPAIAQTTPTDPRDPGKPASVSAPDPQAASAPQSTEPDSGATGSDIIVSSTRITRAGYDAPTPTTVIDAARIQAAAPANLSDYVNNLPALIGSNTPRIGTSGASGTVGSNLYNLRSLGPNRTLVLLDGHRIVPSTLTSSVDVNLLPQALVQRVDVITGGASAAWGSDAVAGVINYVLDRKFTGLSANIESGISQLGDARTFKVELAGGVSFAGGRGHLIVSGEYNDDGPAGDPTTRSWFTGRKVIPNPAFTPTTGQPARLVRDNVGLNNESAGSLITGPATVVTPGGTIANPLLNLTFNSDGSTSQYRPGTISGVFGYGGAADDVSDRISLSVPLKFGLAYSRASFEFSPAFTIYGEASYARAKNDIVGRVFERTAFTIRRDNPYLPANIVTQMTALNLQTIQIGRMFLDQGGIRGENDRSQQRYVIGAEGNLGGSWTYDTYFQHGLTKFTVGNFVNDPILSRFALAADAVPSNGQIVCRSTLTDPTNGCSPINILGEYNASPAALSYIYGSRSVQRLTITQDVAALTFRGDPFKIWAGPVSVAFGGEYRRETFTAGADTLSLTNAYFIGNYKPAAGSFNVKEGFFETVVPLLRDLPFAKNFDLNAAIRYTDYSNSGTVTTWKVGATWALDSQIKFRGVLSRDIRAPNLNELFAGGTTLNQTVNDPVSGTSYSAQTVTLGNLNVTPEKADTKSLGVVFQPKFLPGFQASVDYYDIKIKDAIATLTAQNIIDRCQAGLTQYCAFIARGSNGLISTLRLVPLNVSAERTNGLDFEASWRGALGSFGSLDLRTVATYVHERSLTTNNITINYAGTNANEAQFATAVPSWRLLNSATLTTGNLTTTLTNRFIGAGKLVGAWVDGVDVDNNHVKAVTYFDLALSFRIPKAGKNTAVYFAIQNLLNQAPPASPNSSTASTIQTGVNGYLYDTIGRQFRVGFRTKF